MQVYLAELTPPHVGGSPVEPALGGAVSDEVLGSSCHALGQVHSLQTLHEGRAHPGDQIWVLAIGLLGSSPTRVAGDVEHGGQPMMSAYGPHLSPDNRAHFPDQAGLPRRGDSNR